MENEKEIKDSEKRFDKSSHSKKDSRKNEHQPHHDDTRHLIEKLASLKNEIQDLNEKLSQKDAEIKKLSDDMLLVRADAENYRKRADKDREEAVGFANKSIIIDLLPAVDSVDIALKSIEDVSVKEGVEMIRSSILNVLKKWGVEVIDILNKEFDPLCCEACLFEEREGGDVDLVVEILQDGYKLNGKVIRAAKVKVAKNIK